MRTWIALLLIVLLPLQVSWAAVADYCGHEPGTGVTHVGHHDHQGHGHAGHAATAKAAPDPTGPSDSVLAGAADLDCSHCHGHTVGLPDQPAPLAMPALRAPPCSTGTSPVADHLPPPPERPQWARLA